MDTDELEEQVLDEFAEEQGVNVSSCESFYEKLDVVESAVEDDEDVSFSTEVELEMTVTLPVSVSVDSIVASGGWLEYSLDDVTREVADSGIGRAGDISSLSVTQIHNW